MSHERGKRLVVGISGASGISLAVHLLRLLSEHSDVERVHLVVTSNALRVGASEIQPPATSPAAIVGACALSAAAASRIMIHPDSDVAALIASGSYATDGMVVIPCSSGTLAAIAHGISRGLLQRAADLTLKERRRLILVHRETPLSLVHAENIVKVTQAGAIVMPPVPAFYIGQTWEQYLDHFCMRVLDLLGLQSGRPDLRWQGVHARHEDDSS